MKNPLDGSFSGLWACEICGYGGFLCRCEHIIRLEKKTGELS